MNMMQFVKNPDKLLPTQTRSFKIRLLVKNARNSFFEDAGEHRSLTSFDNYLTLGVSSGLTRLRGVINIFPTKFC